MIEQKMHIITVKEINEQIKYNCKGYIQQCEQEYEHKLQEVANSLAENINQKPIILLSGPSGSGKTTSALRIEKMLQKKGINTHTISMDNYFLPEIQTPDAVDEHGKIDYESPKRMDIALFKQHMIKLANCEEISVPRFDFAGQFRLPEVEILKRKPHELIIFEGIHALNPEVTGNTEEIANCIYVSVRTRLKLSDGTALHPAFIRLMRRLVRDRLYRGRKFVETFDMYKGVRRGEELFILPYKYRANYSIDTFIPYELAAFKNIMLKELEMSVQIPEYNKFRATLEFISHCTAIDDLSAIPQNSLVKEFIGNQII